MVEEETIQKYAYINGAFEACAYAHKLLGKTTIIETRRLLLEEMKRMGEGQYPSYREEEE